jgi:hypothetical protein
MLAGCKRAWGWIAERAKDLLYGPGNNHLDIGRVTALGAALLLSFAALWNMYLKQPIDLGPGGLGGGLAAILTAAVVYIYHDRKGDAP